MTPDVTKQELTATAETVLARRYYLKTGKGNITESWETLARRVADAIAEVDRQSKEYPQLREDFFTYVPA